MKFWKLTLRIWITTASLLSFLGGWAVLAHSPKPNQFKSENLPAVPALDPIPSLDQIRFAQRNFTFSNNQRPIRLHTGGS